MTTPVPPADRQRPPLGLTEALLLLLLACALLLGGGPNEPVLRVALLCLVACVLGAFALTHGAAGAFWRLPVLVRLGVLAFPLLWLLQLVPLAPAIGEGLPGRDLVRQVRALVNACGGWHPLSLTPSDTLFGAVMLLPGLAAFLAGLMLDARGRERCVALFLVLAALSILAGLVQLSSRGTMLNFHDSGHKANFPGFFANRNHQGLMLAIAGVFAVDAVRRHVRSTPAALAAALVVALVVLVCLVGTTSRAALALAAAGMLATFAAGFAGKQPVRRWAVVGGGAAVLAVLFSLSPVVRSTLSRFADIGDDSRWQFWERSAPLLSQYFPWGGGLGGFTRHYNPVETLDAVNPRYLNHAHNDYLEVLIEAGLPGIAALLLFALALAIRAVKIAGKTERTSLGVPAGIAIALVALHSLVDYPLRTQAHGVLFGLLAAFFLTEPVRSGGGAQGGLIAAKRSRLVTAAALFALVCAGCVAGFRAAMWHQSLDHPGELPFLTVPDVPVPEDLKTSLVRRLAAEPLDTGALNLLYAVEVRESAAPMMRAQMAGVLAQMGWRNSAAQQNLMLEAAREGDLEAAMARADGLLRRNLLADRLLPGLRLLEGNKDASAILVRRLAPKPNWRAAYFADAGHLGDPSARMARLGLFNGMIAGGDCPSPAEMMPSLDAFKRAGDHQAAAGLQANPCW